MLKSHQPSRQPRDRKPSFSRKDAIVALSLLAAETYEVAAKRLGLNFETYRATVKRLRIRVKAANRARLLMWVIANQAKLKPLLSRKGSSRV